jgi:hypothetical protein
MRHNEDRNLLKTPILESATQYSPPCDIGHTSEIRLRANQYVSEYCVCSRGPSWEVLRPLFFLHKEKGVVIAAVELVGHKGSRALSISWFLVRQSWGDQDVRMPNA